MLQWFVWCWNSSISSSFIYLFIYLFFREHGCYSSNFSISLEQGIHYCNEYDFEILTIKFVSIFFSKDRYVILSIFFHCFSYNIDWGFLILYSRKDSFLFIWSCFMLTLDAKFPPCRTHFHTTHNIILRQKLVALGSRLYFNFLYFCVLCWDPYGACIWRFGLLYQSHCGLI